MVIQLKFMEQLNGNTNHIFDIPGPTPTSIGTVEWNPVPVSEDRAKNIYPEVLSNRRDFLGLVATFHDYPFTADISRYSTRVFVTDRTLKDLGLVDHKLVAQYIEGIIPLTGCGSVIDDCALVYLGKNTAERTPPDSVIYQEIAKAQTTFETPDNRPPQIPECGYEIRVLTAEDRSNPEIQIQYADLYSVFGYGQDDIIKMLANRQNTMVSLFDGEIVISTGMIEHAVLNLNRNGQPVNFNVGEVTEGYTREEADGKIYRGRGLYTYVVSELMRHEARNDINLIYAESNTDQSIRQPYPPVLLSARRQGRRSTIPVLEEYGFPPNLLRQHVHIKNDGHDNRPQNMRNDLLPTFMVRNELLRRYGK